jgi:hypothetical protein
MTETTMGMAMAEWALLVLAGYLAAGLAFGLAFVGRGAAVVDPAARGMPLPVRVLILPGAAALWPWLLLRWLRRQQPPMS